MLDREPLALQCALLNAQLNGLPVAASATQQLPSLAAVASHLPQQLASTLVELAAGRQRQQQQQQAGASPGEGVVSAHVFDWSQPGDLERFDVLLCCDVLYERFSVEVRRGFMPPVSLFLLEVSGAERVLPSLPLQPVAKVAPRLLRHYGSQLLLADPPLRAKHNRERFLELMAAGGEFSLQEMEQRQVRTWNEGRATWEQPAVVFMTLRSGSPGDTIGVKL